MPIPSFPTCTPRSVDPCDCCSFGSPASVPPRDDATVCCEPDLGIDDFLSDAFVIAGPGGNSGDRDPNMDSDSFGGTIANPDSPGGGNSPAGDNATAPGTIVVIQ